MITAKYVVSTPNAEATMAYIARVSSPKDVLEKYKEPERLLGYCMRNGHWSVFEHAHLTIEVEAPILVTRQILRHRSFVFSEFCVSGDTLISTVTAGGRVKLRPIRDLYTLQDDTRWGRLVRVYDEESKTLVSARVKEVFRTGVKEVYRLTLQNGKSLVATADHKIITPGGWTRLGELVPGSSVVGTNGVPTYQDKDWLALQRSNVPRKGLSQIAEAAGVTIHTIRKWLRIHGLQFTRQEVAEYTPVWNKGKPSEEQPGYRKLKSDATREKMKAASRRGAESEFYIDGRGTSWRMQVASWQNKYRLRLLTEAGEQCSQCGGKKDLQIDHRIPVALRPDLAFEYSNLQILCSPCHKQKSKEERETLAWSYVKSVELVGQQETYDMEIDHVSHNYVANGIITHNSQRYAEVPEEFLILECRTQDHKNRQSSHVSTDAELNYWWQTLQTDVSDILLADYRMALSKGIAKEVARAILPMSTMSTIFMTGSVRSWVHYLQTRLDVATQKEHREVAILCATILAEHFPIVYEAMNLKEESDAAPKKQNEED